MPERLKVLMSAYACEPNRGSEPEVGWRNALEMAHFHDVTVVTRANNRLAVKSELESVPEPHPSFLYYDPPRWTLTLKKRGLPVSLFYLLWQIGVRLHLRSKLRDFDLVHHVTFNSLVIPGFWWFCPCPVILGPLGGGQITPWRFLRCFGLAAPVEALRSLVVLGSGFLPHVLLSFACANRILAVNRDTEKRIPFFLRHKTGRMLETAMDPAGIPKRLPPRGEQECSFLWVGRFVRWKGATLALKAFARARKDEPLLRLVLIGKGPEEKALRKLAADLGVHEAVSFLGQIPKDQMISTMMSHDAFMFTSLHDTSGNALIEAMAAGLPAIVLNHHGPAEITTDQTALRIPVTTPGQTIQGLAAAMLRLSGSLEMGRRMGQAARARVLGRLTWLEHTKALDAHYRESLQRDDG